MVTSRPRALPPLERPRPPAYWPRPMGRGTLSAMRTLLLCLGLLLAALPARAAAQFDYWVLALSWSPTYCAADKNARRSPDQCGEAKRFGLVLHGLWPQRQEGGSPANCRTKERPSRQLVDRMMPVMPDDGLIRHQWEKHGSCTGLAPEDYFALAERAFRSVRVPAALDRPSVPQAFPVTTIEQFLRQENPAITPETVAVICEGQDFEELRLCLDKDLQPRRCGPRVADRCPRGTQAVVRPVK